MVSNRFRSVFVRCVAVALAVTACLVIIASVQAYVRVGNAVSTARTQLQTTSANLAQAADSVQMASTAVLNASTTVTNAQSALTSAAGIVQSASTGTGAVGNIAGFTIPFTQIRPFGNAQDTLNSEAAQIGTLADSLSRTASSLGTNATDLRVAAASVADVATRLRELSNTVAQFAGDDGGLTKIADAARASAMASIFLSVLGIAVAGAFWLLAPAEPASAEATVQAEDRPQPAAASSTAAVVPPPVPDAHPGST
jgi:hypothetical protein